MYVSLMCGVRAAVWLKGKSGRAMIKSSEAAVVPIPSWRHQSRQKLEVDDIAESRRLSGSKGTERGMTAAQVDAGQGKAKHGRASIWLT